MDFIKLREQSFIPEPSPSACDRYSHPAFIKRVPPGLNAIDFDEKEMLVEIEHKIDGSREWWHASAFFGKMIFTVKDILMLYPNDHTEGMHIATVIPFKEKRTIYMKLIFERDLPF